jgi:signal transduction histidine kinase
LSICYAIIAEHGGRIEVESTPGEGSVFRILLPRADETGDTK